MGYAERMNELMDQLNKSIQSVNKLDYYKKELLKILDEKERKEEILSKSIQEYFDGINKTLFGISIEKGRVGTIGEIRTWKDGKRYKKMLDGKWVRVYQNQDRHAEISIARLKGKVRNAKSVDELMNIVMANVHRFEDENGKCLEIVLELKNEIDIKKSILGKRENEAFQNLKSFVTKKNYNLAKGKTRETIFSEYDNTPKTIAIVPKKYVDFFDLKSDELKCGLAYMMDHIVNHHPVTPLPLYERIQYIFNQGKDFYYDPKNNSFVITEDFGINKKNKPNRNIFIFGIENESLVLHKTFYDTHKNLPSKFKKINLADKQGFKSLVDSLTTISQSDNSDSAIGLNIHGRNDNLLIPSSNNSVNELLEKKFENIPISTSDPKFLKYGEEHIKDVINSKAKLYGGFSRDEFYKKLDEYKKIHNSNKNIFSPSDIDKMIEFTKINIENLQAEINSEDNVTVKSGKAVMIIQQLKAIKQLEEWFDTSKTDPKFFNAEWKKYYQNHPERFTKKDVHKSFTDTIQDLLKVFN